MPFSLMVMAKGPARTKPVKSGIKVIVVGAGFGGLSCAIECHRHGHDVEVFEQAPAFAMLGMKVPLYNFQQWRVETQKTQET